MKPIEKLKTKLSSLRRYKEGVYAIPYEGEEVKLHWANVNRYFIKSSDFRRGG